MFDSAIRGLQSANDNLNKARSVFENAHDDLKSTQKKVDNLCKIRTCWKLCIPGVRLSICRGWWGIRYPCFRFSNCMISIPNPVCVAANVVCSVIRLAAYLALEAAKVVVRIPMIALDIAKAVVYSAQFAVDKSRVVLEIAKATLDLANLGLEVAKGIFDAANIALDGIKNVVRLGFMALNLIIEHGLQSIIDVRNCGFKVEFTSHDKAVFDVHCEVNAFLLGFKTVKIRINFTDIVHSLWNAAKATIEAVFNSMGIVISGKRKRGLQHKTVHTLYSFLRQTRNAEDFSVLFLNETMDVIAQTIGFKNSSDGTAYDFRREVFETKCRDFKTVYNFLNDSIQVLKDISEESATTLLNTTHILDEINNVSTNNTMMNMSLEDIGIDLNVAEREFNISIDDLNELVQKGKDNLTNNDLLNEIRSFTHSSADLLESQIDDANNIGVLNQWIMAMENLTLDYFTSNVCVSFFDCSQFGIYVLYEMYMASDVADPQSYLDIISDLENSFLNLTGNSSYSIADVYALAMEIDGYLDHLQEKNIFCSTPPVMMEPLANTIFNTGETLVLACNVTGDPHPTFRWYKDDEIIEEFTSMIFSIHSVTTNDTGWYYCVAGNLVANLTFRETFVDVTGEY